MAKKNDKTLLILGGLGLLYFMSQKSAVAAGQAQAAAVAATNKVPTSPIPSTATPTVPVPATPGPGCTGSLTNGYWVLATSGPNAGSFFYDDDTGCASGAALPPFSGGGEPYLPYAGEPYAGTPTYEDGNGNLLAVWDGSQWQPTSLGTATSILNLF